MGRKHCGKRRNCSLRAISPFPTVFSKGLFPRGVKRCHCVGMGLLFAIRKILDLSKLKEFADDILKFDENGRKFSKQVENTVRKGEIACYQQFVIFPQCFQKTSIADTKNQGLFGKGLTLYHTIPIF